MVIVMKKLVYGVGVNDSTEYTYSIINGEKVRCKVYKSWTSMLERCYSRKFHEKSPTYIGCIHCDEWKMFSNFKGWIESQDWQGKQLDKDLLITGNKVYSPDKCLLVTPMVNSFITDCGSARGLYPLGVNVCKKTSAFEARCRNPFTNKKEYLGRFSDQNEAHLVWKKRKHELACRLAEIQTDERVAKALCARYA